MSTPGFTGPVARRSSALELSRIAERQVPLAWFEAVAIVQELCAVVLGARGAASQAALEPSDVIITSDGGIEVRGRAAQGTPTVPQVAHLLLTLIEGTQALPVQLRLLALEASSPTPGCATLSELSGRLAPFERPNRRHIIREIYERVTQLPLREPETPANQPVQAQRARPGARPPWWRSRRLRAAAGSVVLIAAAGVTAAWLWRAVVPLLLNQDGRQTADTGVSAGEGSLSASDVERIWATARRIWSRPPARPPVPAPDPSPDAAPFGPPPSVDLPPGPSSSKPVAPRLPDAAAAVSTRVVDETVFSAVDAEVVPPLLVRPRLPAAPRAGVRAQDLPRVEVVVSPAGEVESVKLLTRQSGVGPAMMLSAIKAWRFEPATRAGRPVRYRLVVPLTNQ